MNCMKKYGKKDSKMSMKADSMKKGGMKKNMKSKKG